MCERTGTRPRFSGEKAGAGPLFLPKNRPKSTDFGAKNKLHKCA